jgi:hypothetical protein
MLHTICIDLIAFSLSGILIKFQNKQSDPHIQACTYSRNKTTYQKKKETKPSRKISSEDKNSYLWIDFINSYYFSSAKISPLQ